MRKRFDDVLDECIRQLEASGGDVETVLSRYPEHATKLRSYLEVWTALSAVEKVQATSAGTMRGRHKLLTAVAETEQAEESIGSINSLVARGGLNMKFVGMKFAGMFVAGAVLALAITFLTGSLEFGDTSSAQAQIPVECLASLDLNGDGSFDVGDVMDFRDAIENQTTEGFDRDNDGDVDIFDLVEVVSEMVACFQESQPPAPTPPAP